MKQRERILSVTKDDCSWDVFRAGGKGGQAQNKLESGVRCRHKPSGAVGESREERSQLLNRRKAFKRMAESAEFQRWLRVEIARANGELAAREAAVDSEVRRQMRPANLKVEVGDGTTWVEVEA